MAPKTGRNTTVGIGLEGAWGTAVSRTQYYRIKGSTLDHGIDEAMFEALHQGVDGSALGSAITGINVAGTLSGELGYGQIGFILLAALGSVAEDTGSSPKVFTYEGTLDLPSLTIDQTHGNTGESRVYEGMKVGSLTISWESGSIASWEAAFVGETVSAMGSAPSPTYTDPAKIAAGNTALTATWNSQTLTGVKRFSVTIDNQLQTDRPLASPYVSEPVSSGKKVSGQMTLQYKAGSYNPLADSLTETQSDLVFDFNRASSTDNFEIRLRNAKLRTAQTVSSPGIIEQVITFEGYADGSDSAISMILKNGNSDHEA